ncbi:TetR family transcriptional regulator [Subtercola endophyticus]|uniref:TetR family transcriptional regulator n=1 Tax=Subtercola endophyticus TaxID=2895559 RepID=UPI001E4370F9|nr:TetR family transcriptional regulator [Subtercola endophyticus]UFS60189.1 TetR family transcriptional regulator [Subtercola endophyticus]
MSEDRDGRITARPAAAQGTQLYAPLRRAALELFESKGFEATTAEDIALAAGISRRTFFRYFPVREDVLFSDHADYLLLVEERLRSLGAGGGGGGAEPIAIAGAALAPVIDGQLADVDFVVRRSALVRSNRALRDREVLWLREYQQLLGDFLTRQDLGSRSEIYAQIVAAALLAALSQVFERWFRSPSTEDPRALFAELLDEIGESMGDSGPRGQGPGREHPERPGVVVINSGLSANEIAKLIEGAGSRP